MTKQYDQFKSYNLDGGFVKNRKDRPPTTNEIKSFHASKYNMHKKEASMHAEELKRLRKLKYLNKNYRVTYLSHLLGHKHHTQAKKLHAIAHNAHHNKDKYAVSASKAAIKYSRSIPATIKRELERYKGNRFETSRIRHPKGSMKDLRSIGMWEKV